MNSLSASLLEAAAVLVAAIAVPYCLYSVVAIWAGVSRCHWFLRALVVVAALLVMLPTRVYEGYVFFLILVGTILAVSIIVRRFSNAEHVDQAVSIEKPARRPFRFRLADLFLLVLLIAIVTTATAYVFRQPMRFSWLGMLLTSFSNALAALATTWLVFGRRKLLWRVLVWFAATTCASLSWLVGDWLEVEDNMLLQWDKCLLFVPCYLLFSLWCMLWFGSFSPVNWPASPTAKPAKKWSRWTARIALVCSTVICAVFPAGWMYAQLARPLPDQVAMTANPNGFDDLIRAGSQLNSNTIPDIEFDSTATLQAFVDDHSRLVEQTRTALPKPCQVPLDYSYDDLRPKRDKLRNLAYLFRLLAVLAQRQSRPEDAARAGVDCVRLAHKGAKGGMLYDFAMSIGLEDMGMPHIGMCRKDLNAEACREFIAVLERIDGDREPIASFSRRDDDWMRIVVGWRHDFWQYIYKLAGFDDGLEQYEEIQQRSMATMRLLITELALQAYHEEHGRYPERLEGLVPDLIGSVPIDPFDEQPLRYRLDESGEYVLYSVGPDGIDDGGEYVSEQKVIRGEGDFFLDAIVEEAEE